MLDQAFLDFLEYKICNTLEGSGLWCDGVTISGSLNHKKEIYLTAFVGKDGQTRYELILRLGNKSLGLYERNLDLKACWPEGDREDWFDIDTHNARMAIQLD